MTEFSLSTLRERCLRGVKAILGYCSCVVRAVFGALGFSLCVVLNTTAYAEEIDYDVTALLGTETNGVFRGAKSRNFVNPTIYGAVEISLEEFYGGVYSNPVRIAGEKNALVLGYVGYAPTVQGLDLNLGARYYAFPGSSKIGFDTDGDDVIDKVGRLGVLELSSAVSKSFDGGKLTAMAFWSPNFVGETGDAYYFNGEVRFDLIHDFQLRASGGVSRFEDTQFNDNYADWGIGIYREVKGFDLSLRYSDSIGLAGSDDRVLVFGIERAWTLASKDKAYRRRYGKILNDVHINKTLLAAPR